jgi:hypothetical protein
MRKLDSVEFDSDHSRTPISIRLHRVDNTFAITPDENLFSNTKTMSWIFWDKPEGLDIGEEGDASTVKYIAWGG